MIVRAFPHKVRVLKRKKGLRQSIVRDRQYRNGNNSHLRPMEECSPHYSSKIRKEMKQAIAKTSMNVELVSFDVGGRVYRMSASLLAKYPSTRLAKIYRANWKKKSHWDLSDDDEEQESPLFLDGNPDRFQYVIDYMIRRYDIMFIPNTISKDALLNDLESYGFDVDPSTILVQGQKVTNIEHFEHVSALENELKATLSKIKKRKFDNLESTVEQMLDCVRKRKLQIENERDT